jgi:hypothetical protein
MTLWRIRVAVPDDAGSRGALTSALAGQPMSGLRVLPGTSETSAATSEIVVELPHDDRLATVLSALHEISPQVFVSRAEMPVPESQPELELPRVRYGV